MLHILGNYAPLNPNPGQRIKRSALLWEANCLKKGLGLRPFFTLSSRKLTNFRQTRKTVMIVWDSQRAETHRGPERHETPLRGEQVSVASRNRICLLKGESGREGQMANITRYY